MNLDELRNRVKNEKQSRISSSNRSITATGDNNTDSVLRAAMNGDVAAQVQMAKRYDLGIDGYEIDEDKALEWTLKAANNGHNEAQAVAGYTYFLKEDYTSAEKWCRKAVAQTNNLDGIYWLGQTLDAQKKFEEAYRWYEKGTALGDERCICEQGIDLYYGIGTEENEEKAKTLLQSLDPNKFLKASSVLGRYYTNKEHRDLEKAINYLKLCATDGLANGGWGSEMEQLGHIFWDDNEYQDYEQARKWFANAISEGTLSACVSLGVMYECGHGVKENSQKAKNLFEQAAMEGETQAMCFLADMLMTEGHRNEAIEWYKKSADGGYEDAKKKLEELGEKVTSPNDEEYWQAPIGQNIIDKIQSKWDKFDEMMGYPPKFFDNFIKSLRLGYPDSTPKECDYLKYYEAFFRFIYFDSRFLEDDFDKDYDEYYAILDEVDTLIGDMHKIDNEAAYLYTMSNMYSADRFKDIQPLDKLEQLWEELSTIPLDGDSTYIKIDFLQEKAKNVYELVKAIHNS